MNKAVASQADEAQEQWSVTEGRGPDDELLFHEIRTANGTCIASTWAGPNVKRANLIAAAPELLKALKEALTALEAISDEMTVGERYTNAGQYLIDALQPARTAIRKATQPQTSRDSLNQGE